jgi:hypothetical protein
MRVCGGAEEEQRGGTGGPGAEGSAEDSTGGYGGAQQIGFEKFSDKIRDGHGAPADELHHFLFSEAADFSPDFQELPKILFGRLFDDRRSEDEKLSGDCGGAGDLLG